MSQSQHGASRVSSLISMGKTIVGAGLLSMPLAFSTDGIIFGIFIMAVAAVTAGYGLFLQAYVSKYVLKGHATFFNVCAIMYPMLSVVFDLAIAVQCFGCAVSYLVIVGDLMPTIINSVFGVSQQNLRVFWIAALGLVCVPLSFLKNLDSLKYTSMAGLGAIAYLCVLVVLEKCLGHVPAELRGEIRMTPISWKHVFSTFSIIVFAFSGHQNTFSIINEAQNKLLTSLTALVNTAVIGASSLYIVVGLCGYLTFGSAVGGNIVLQYPTAWWTEVGRFAIVFMVVFLFPLMIHPARISVNNIYYWMLVHVVKKSDGMAETGTVSATNDESTALLPHENESDLQQKASNVMPFSNTTFCTITTVLLGLGYFLAATLESFALVLAIVGATGLTSISFILPGLFGYKLIGLENSLPLKSERILRGLALSLTIWGFFVMVVCLYSSLAL